MVVAEVISRRDLDALYVSIKGKLQNASAEVVVEQNAHESSLTVCAARQREEEVRQLLAHEMVDFVIREVEPEMVYQMIKRGYRFLNTMEKVELMQEVQQALTQPEELGEPFLQRRKNLLHYAMLQYLREKKRLHIDGFVRFRAKEYLMELEDFVDRAADEFITMQEYENFLDVLRYFVSMREEKVDVVHVVAKVTGEYLLLDRAGYEMIDREVDAFIEEMDICEKEQDDILLSSLMVLAPKKMILHNPNFIPLQLRRTLEQVFIGRVRLCGECVFCQMGRDIHLH